MLMVMKKPLRNYPAKFKTWIALEVLRDEATLGGLSARRACLPSSAKQRATWRKQRPIGFHFLEMDLKSLFIAGHRLGVGICREASLRDENEQLKRELLRKEKSLAEVAALLVLQNSSRRSGRQQVVALFNASITVLI
jgi:hypothetical protein